MVVPFSQLPDHSRIWIYPSNRKFSASEITQLKSDIEQFYQIGLRMARLYLLGIAFRMSSLLSLP